MYEPPSDHEEAENRFLFSLLPIVLALAGIIMLVFGWHYGPAMVVGGTSFFGVGAGLTFMVYRCW